MKKFYSIWEDGYWNGTMSALLTEYGFDVVYSPNEADVLVFNGGADIATKIYNEKPIFKGIPEHYSRRDVHELELFDKFKGQKFMLGICRGAQLLNCLQGGTLWQHVNNHQVDHKMVDTRTGDTFMVTSTHHQMMRPTKNAEIIGTAKQSTIKSADQAEWVGIPDKDIEVVYYPGVLCIQGHPEYVPGTKFSDWSVDLLNEKMKAA